MVETSHARKDQGTNMGRLGGHAEGQQISRDAERTNGRRQISKGKILVDYKTHTANWTLSVTDDGVGMPTQPSSAKAGLGTSIVQALTRQLGAIISVVGANPGTKISIVHVHVPVLVSQSLAVGEAV